MEKLVVKKKKKIRMQGLKSWKTLFILMIDSLTQILKPIHDTFSLSHSVFEIKVFK